MRRLLLALVLLCALAALPSARTRAASCDVDPAQVAPTAQEQAVIDQNNAYRAGHGLAPLIYDAGLSRMALWKANENAAIGSAEHDDPFRSWQQRFADCGFPIGPTWLGENLAAGQRSAAEVEGDWQASPHHNENLLRPEFTHIAVKCVAGVAPYYTYWVMELRGGA